MSELGSLVSDAAVPGPQEMDTWLAKEGRAPETWERAQPCGLDSPLYPLWDGFTGPQAPR